MMLISIPIPGIHLTAQGALWRERLADFLASAFKFGMNWRVTVRANMSHPTDRLDEIRWIDDIDPHSRSRS